VIDIHDNELSECATDSAKIRAMQGRNSEPEPISKKWEGKDDLRLDLPSDINDDATDDHLCYFLSFLIVYEHVNFQFFHFH
jgi:hypothetical protein